MKKLVGFYSVALIFLMLAVPVLSTGCGCLRQACQPYGPRVTGNGTGGAIAVYEAIKDNYQRDFYVQKISPEGKAVWGEGGVLIGRVYKECDSYFSLFIVDDGSGGAFIVWSGYPSEPDWRLAPGQRQIEYLTHITRVDAEGSIMWQREVMGAGHVVSDGTSGVLVASDESYDEETLFVIKIDSEGNFPWGEKGVYTRREGYCDHTLGLVSDGNGGAIFIWQERKGEPGKKTTRIFTQRINAEGSLPWGQDGVLLYTTSEEVNAEEPRITSDGSGGAIIVWLQWPKGRIESGMPEALLHDIYAQRVDAQGKALWTDNGVPLGITKGGGEYPRTALVVSDGASGAIILWQGTYAQNIGADGNIKWQPSGKLLSSSGPQRAVSDGSRGAIFTFGRIRAQRIDADGRTMWPDDGILFTDSKGTHDISCDGYGGAVIAWGIGKDMFSSEKSYVQRISADGKLLWGDKGIRLNP